MDKLGLIIFTVHPHSQGCDITTDRVGVEHLNKYNVSSSLAANEMFKISNYIENMDYCKKYKCLFIFD